MTHAPLWFPPARNRGGLALAGALV